MDIRKEVQYGGSNFFSSVDGNTVDNILNGNYSINKNLQNKANSYANAYNLNTQFECLKNSDDNIDINNFINYDNNNTDLKYICIYGKDKHTSKNKQSALYKFKANLKDEVTGIYIKSIDLKKNQEIVINIIFFLNEQLKDFILKYNNINKTDYDSSKFNILYKGGNVINLYFRTYIDMLTKNHRNNVKINKLFDYLNFIMKRGDWDFTLSISDKIDENFNDKIKTLVLYLLTIIQKELESKMQLDTKKLLQNMQKSLFIDNNVGQLIDSLKKDTGTKKHIKLLYVKTPYGAITGKNNTDIVAVDEPGLQKYSGISTFPSTNISNYFDVDTFLGDRADKIPKMHIFTIFIEKLFFFKMRYYSSFDLARIKINNNVEFYMDGKQQRMQTPAEIIDMSFINKSDDVQQKMINDSILTHGGKKFVYYEHDNKKFPFLSLDFIFWDLHYILFEQHFFLWADRKYDKRLKRLITTSIFLSLDRGFLDINKTYDILNQLKKNNSVADKIKFLEPYIDIVSVADVPNIIVKNKSFNDFISMIIANIFKIMLYMQYVDNIKYDKYTIFVDYMFKPIQFPQEFNEAGAINSNPTYKDLVDSKSENINNFGDFLDKCIEYIGFHLVLSTIENNYRIENISITNL
jgi:hypothetical protein